MSLIKNALQTTALVAGLTTLGQAQNNPDAASGNDRSHDEYQTVLNKLNPRKHYGRIAFLDSTDNNRVKATAKFSYSDLNGSGDITPDEIEAGQLTVYSEHNVATGYLIRRRDIKDGADTSSAESDNYVLETADLKKTNKADMLGMRHTVYEAQVIEQVKTDPLTQFKLAVSGMFTDTVRPVLQFGFWSKFTTIKR